MLTYLDYMGYDYFETLFKKTPPKEKKENKRQNCVNCGAPLTYGDVCVSIAALFIKEIK